MGIDQTRLSDHAVLPKWVRQPDPGARGGAPRQEFYLEVDGETYEDAERRAQAQLTALIELPRLCSSKFPTRRHQSA